MKTPHKHVIAFALCLISVAALVGAGKADTNIRVKAIWIYPFESKEAGVFNNATVIEKNSTGIKFKADDKVYEHCGHYTVEN